MTALLKLALVPLLVGLASWLSRTYGHRVAGVLSGLPLIAGPILTFLALEDIAFARKSAEVTLLTFSANFAHYVAFGYAARRLAWGWALLAGLVAYFVLMAVLYQIHLPVWAAMLVSFGILLLAYALLPEPRDLPQPAAVPNWELALRIGFAVLVTGFILFVSTQLGPTMAGLALSLPISGLILPCFVLKLYGTDATVYLLRGFITGLAGFIAFFALAAATLGAWPLGLVVGLGCVLSVATAMAFTKFVPLLVR
jgi:hypothetical protein